ncbi:acetyl-CoA acetyltransferase [Ancylobacter aquaticus]|uniref:Acetyl-CoA acetyltransferase n=2 Tax=Ancylobacter aquaticus TaxID=100 RepID=A0A4R1IA57_ANCAQ|nr:acetyl-CoA acetyltransferase [Ancylobacter aquaticus]
MASISGKASIVGAYESPRRQAPRLHPFALQMECIAGALDDAGIALSEVDGLCVAASDWAEGGGVSSLTEFAEYAGITPTFFDSTDVGGCSYIVHAGHAAAAIATGLAEVVVISYAACPRWWPLDTPSFDPFVLPAGPGQFELPYGPTLISAYALFAQRHMALYGTTSEQLARVAVTFREHAANNPHARFTAPITIDDVLASTPIASPLRKLDCCVVTDGGGAIVMTSAERAKDCRRRPVHLAGFGSAAARTQISQIALDLSTPAAISGPRAFAMAGIGHDDIDVAQIYDAFTITPMLALEDLGFCGRGESGGFVDDGHLTLGGRLPTNTDGGGLSSNHPGKRGIFTLIEGVRQLRGEGPGLQIPDAEVALVHGLGGTFCAAATAILTV